MHPLIARLLERCTFPAAGTPADCAVSGGADSLALLVLATAAGCEVTAWHVDHGLRSGSSTEGDVVAAAAHRFGAAFEARRVTVAAGPNLEARARAARLSVLPSDALTGHTADDQAETVLMNLLRGAGLRGLRGMDAERHPILGLRRSETHRLCAELELIPVVDPSNFSPVFLRNRVRHELLPMLDEMSRRDLTPILARQAQLIGDDDRFLDELAADIDPTDALAITNSPPVLARRALRRWLAARPGNDERHPPSAEEVERVFTVARGERVACEIEGGVRVSRHRQRLFINEPGGFATHR